MTLPPGQNLLHPWGYSFGHKLQPLKLKDSLVFFIFCLCSRIDRKDKKAVSEGNKYFTIEGSVALFVSFILNIWVIGTFGNGLFGVTYQEAYDTCNNTDSIYTEDLLNENGK